MNNRFCNSLIIIVTLTILTLLSTSFAQTATPSPEEIQKLPWMNKNLTPDERADLVLKADDARRENLASARQRHGACLSMANAFDLSFERRRGLRRRHQALRYSSNFHV